MSRYKRFSLLKKILMILLCNFCNLNYKIKQKDIIYKLIYIDDDHLKFL